MRTLAATGALFLASALSGCEVGASLTSSVAAPDALDATAAGPEPADVTGLSEVSRPGDEGTEDVAPTTPLDAARSVTDSAVAANDTPRPSSDAVPTVADAGASPPRDVVAPTPAPGRSCATSLMCGPAEARVSCCDAIVVPAGIVELGRSLSGSDAFEVPNPEELPEHPVAVPAFALDRYEVTVGRMRAFVQSWTGAATPEGAGAHPAVPGSGWRVEWNGYLPRNAEDFGRLLHCADGRETWRDEPGPNDERPVGCLNWFEAFAFCVWDGGRLPTETEWERAAAGDENRLYPWGSAPPDCQRVRPFDGCHEADDLMELTGRRPRGAGPWGHLALSGSAKEWVLDYFGDYELDLPPPAARVQLAWKPMATRVLRGLGFWGGNGDLRSADRGSSPPTERYERNGVRCARNVPAVP